MSEFCVIDLGECQSKEINVCRVIGIECMAASRDQSISGEVSFSFDETKVRCEVRNEIG